MLTMTMLVSIWSGLFFVVLTLAGLRKWVSRHEDDAVHLTDSEVELVRHQACVASFLSRLDRWGKVLTVVVLLYGLAILARVFYVTWVQGLQLQQ